MELIDWLSRLSGWLIAIYLRRGSVLQTGDLDMVVIYFLGRPLAFVDGLVKDDEDLSDCCFEKL